MRCLSSPDVGIEDVGQQELWYITVAGVCPREAVAFNSLAVYTEMLIVEQFWEWKMGKQWNSSKKSR